MDDGYKIVHFCKYCKTCKYKNKQEHEEPCAECLNNPVNVESHVPVRYKEEK